MGKTITEEPSRVTLGRTPLKCSQNGTELSALHWTWPVWSWVFSFPSLKGDHHPPCPGAPEKQKQPHIFRVTSQTLPFLAYQFMSNMFHEVLTFLPTETLKKKLDYGSKMVYAKHQNLLSTIFSH